MDKVQVRVHQGVKYVWYHCPGCKHNHSVPAERWNWNGSIQSPTLSPSVRHYMPASEGRPEKTICHYFIVDGKIQFCGDSEHDLKGQTVELGEPINTPENS